MFCGDKIEFTNESLPISITHGRSKIDMARTSFHTNLNLTKVNLH